MKWPRQNSLTADSRRRSGGAQLGNTSSKQIFAFSPSPVCVRVVRRESRLVICAVPVNVATHSKCYNVRETLLVFCSSMQNLHGALLWFLFESFYFYWILHSIPSLDLHLTLHWISIKNLANRIRLSELIL